MFMCVCVCGVLERELDLQELEIRIVVRHCLS